MSTPADTSIFIQLLQFDSSETTISWFCTPPLLTMNVLTLIDSLRRGGAENMAVTIANALSKRRVNSYLCCTRETGPLSHRLSPAVVKFEIYKRSAWDLRAIYRLHQIITRNDINIIHAHNYSVFIALLAKYLPYPKCSTRVVWHYHSEGKSNCRLRVMIPGWLAARWVDAIFVVEGRALQWLAELCGKWSKIHFMENFVMPYSNQHTDSASLPGERGTRIVMVARVDPIKDHLSLLRAFRIVVDRREAAHLFVIGDRVDANYYAFLLDEVRRLNLTGSVTFLGGRDDVQELLAHMDVGVLCSRTEGTPLALLEYGLAGLAVVTTNVGNCSGIVEDNISGRLVEPGNVGALADAILDFLESPEWRKSAGAALRRRILADYSERSVVDKLINVYSRLVGCDSSELCEY